jgi:hypothetical protein
MKEAHREKIPVDQARGGGGGYNLGFSGWIEKGHQSNSHSPFALEGPGCREVCMMASGWLAVRRDRKSEVR